MKAAIDKNETELDKMKREALEWLEIRGKTAPPFIGVAVNAFNAIQLDALAELKAEMPSDEDICTQYPIIAYDSEHFRIRQLGRREGAKWLREQIKSQLKQK